jgi:hypothetical protein
LWWWLLLLLLGIPIAAISSLRALPLLSALVEPGVVTVAATATAAAAATDALFKFVAEDNREDVEAISFFLSYRSYFTFSLIN